MSCFYDLFVHALVFGFGVSALIWGDANNGKVVVVHWPLLFVPAAHVLAWSVFHSQLYIVNSSCQVYISAQSLVVFLICYLLLYSIS